MMISENNEGAVIGILLANPAARHEAQRLLTADDFSIPANRTLWERINALGDHATIHTLNDELARRKELESVGGMASLLDIYTESTGPEHLPFYAEQLTEARIHRAAARISVKLGSDLEAGQEGARDCIAEAMAALGSLGSGRASLPSIREDVFATIEKLEAEKSGEAPMGLVTRWSEMNERVPIRRSSYIVLGGETSSGKSLLAGNLIADVIGKGRAAFFSYEMSRDDIVRRLISDHGKIRPEKLFFPHQNRMTSGEMASLTESQDWLAKSGLHIFDDPGIDIVKLLAIGRTLCAEEPLDALVVDYAQLVPITLAGANRELQVATISRMLRGFSLETGTPTIVITQLNDAGETRESKALKQDAEILLSVETDGGVYVCKQRNGPKNFRLSISQKPGMMSFIETQ